MAFKRLYFSKFSGGACPRTPPGVLARSALVGRTDVRPPKFCNPVRLWEQSSYSLLVIVKYHHFYYPYLPVYIGKSLREIYIYTSYILRQIAPTANVRFEEPNASKPPAKTLFLNLDWIWIQILINNKVCFTFWVQNFEFSRQAHTTVYIKFLLFNDVLFPKVYRYGSLSIYLVIFFALVSENLLNLY